jgi:hypothetical protein
VTPDFEVHQDRDAVTFRVRVSPRASRNAISGVHHGALRASLTAPPVDGEANAALIAFLAKKLSVAKRDVTIVRGDSSRDKTVRVSGVSAEAVRALARG